jgi:coenzyme F420 hydrogenase subunit beta
MTANFGMGFEETLKNVIMSGKCTSCAACVAACPSNCLKYDEEKPRILGECNRCGLCSRICPQYNISQPTLEKFVFGRERTPQEEFGVYRTVLVAKATDKAILDVCQDGGVVTTLLAFALENKIIEGAAVSGIEKQRPLHPIPIFATTTKKILQSAGTKYFYSPNLLALQNFIRQGKGEMAFVGTPCQIEAIRKIQMISIGNFVGKLRLTIGLLCSGSFSYEGLVEKYIRQQLGINPSDVRKINIKTRFTLTMKSGEIKQIPLKDVRPYIRKNCSLCRDFSAELADVSVGGLGLNDWSLVIIRTENGKELFTDAVKAGLLEVRSIEEKKHSLDLLIKLSKKQKSSNI